MVGGGNMVRGGREGERAREGTLCHLNHHAQSVMQFWIVSGNMMSTCWHVHVRLSSSSFLSLPPSLPPSLPAQAEVFAQAAARFRSQAAAFTNMGGGGKPSPSRPSEEEVSETNQRNKAISSSAITRAMADAQTGKTPIPPFPFHCCVASFQCTCTCILGYREPQLPRP